LTLKELIVEIKNLNSAEQHRKWASISRSNRA